MDEGIDRWMDMQFTNLLKKNPLCKLSLQILPTHYNIPILCFVSKHTRKSRVYDIHICTWGITFLMTTLLCRPSLCEGPGGCGAAAGACAGDPAQVLQAASSTGATAVCASAGKADGAAHAQPPPCWDATLLACQRTGAHATALWDLGHVVPWEGHNTWFKGKHDERQCEYENISFVHLMYSEWCYIQKLQVQPEFMLIDWFIDPDQHNPFHCQHFQPRIHRHSEVCMYFQG